MSAVMAVGSFVFTLLCCVAFTLFLALCIRRAQRMLRTAPGRRGEEEGRPAEEELTISVVMSISNGREKPNSAGLSESEIDSLGRTLEFSAFKAEVAARSSEAASPLEEADEKDGGAKESEKKGAEQGKGGVKECPVCLVELSESDTVRVLDCCCNCFHQACIDSWLRSHPSCPLCRKVFRADAVAPPISAAQGQLLLSSLALPVSTQRSTTAPQASAPGVSTGAPGASAG